MTLFKDEKLNEEKLNKVIAQIFNRKE